MDELYVAARKVLLDALHALAPHREAVVVVGAQAVYLHCGEADLAVPPHTTDADLALDPARLGEIPPLERALVDAGFAPGGRNSVGVWLARHPTEANPDLAVQVDLLVPETVSPGRGRRAARLAGHDPMAARIVRGLEGAVVDFERMTITSLDERDQCAFEAKVAGPAALLVAKLHKINERVGTARSSDKDALDVFRLLRAARTADLANRMERVLADERSHDAGARGLRLLGDLFHRGGRGTAMAARAVEGLMDEDEVRASCELLSQGLLREIGKR